MSHPLIPREQTYLLSRKVVTIHSEDRDILKYPDANSFDIKLPQIMKNVQSMRLLFTRFPKRNYYTFSTEYQNTKLSFVVKFDTLSLEPIDCHEINTIEIQPGNYTLTQLTTEIQTKMNKCITQKLGQLYNEMKVTYDVVGQRIMFGNVKHPFLLLFNRKECYKDVCKQPNMWELPIKWGLGYYLGFERATYISICLEKSVSFNYLENNQVWLMNTHGNVYLTIAPFEPDIEGESVIYMEIEKYNSMDELKLCPLNTNGSEFNTYAGYVNSAFAKIQINDTLSGIDTTDMMLQNLTYFDIPEEQISKLHFKFRYHDGRLVNFARMPFNFTLEFNCLKNEIGKSYKVRVPEYS
uniref:DUF5901 domain-containing protein n=1 Tax=viral metagenome TaxID=1070528 RepID=A0A6C0JWQ0_9ZZZZ